MVFCARPTVVVAHAVQFLFVLAFTPGGKYARPIWPPRRFKRLTILPVLRFD